MRLSGFVIGAAAVLMVVSAARAGDAVVPDEWDQQQSVNTCDAYGTGYMKMPGTNTCVKVSGQLRYEKSITSAGSRSGGYLQFETRSD